MTKICNHSLSCQSGKKRETRLSLRVKNTEPFALLPLEPW